LSWGVSMAQALTWLTVLIAIGLIFWVLVRENDRRSERTVDEWEREFAAGQGQLTQFIQAGALGLEGILISEKREAVQYQKDEEQGMTKTGTKGDDADRTAVN
jgi:hypothetical protein